MLLDTIIWRRMDVEGHDACRFEAAEGLYRISGHAVYLEDGVPASLSYQLLCDSDFSSHSAYVSGWVGSSVVEARIERSSDGQWMLNQTEIAGLDSLLDIDLGFTPATNLSQIRRVFSGTQLEASIPVVWFDLSEERLVEVAQSYRRIGERSFSYSSSAFAYAATIEVNESGFILEYPELWKAL